MPNGQAGFPGRSHRSKPGAPVFRSCVGHHLASPQLSRIADFEPHLCTGWSLWTGFFKQFPVLSSQFSVSVFSGQ